MPDRPAPRLEPVPLRLLSLSAQFDAFVSPTLVGMSFTNSIGQAVLQRHVEVRVEGDSDVWVVSSLRGTVLCDVEDPLARAASEVMRVLTELRAVGRTDNESGRADV
ncbi:hypothetical protein DEJ28_02340 [Curtobacterium sp. MCPF17_002]|uniref:hypothetical protein n=1 Tax=Curtobacterium sp. MCPF17_002 TaxID=2175645 RepID=UPI0011B81BE0|nr:hypothetical protein [Curtobacterium sp. MCPF17_002]WIB77956.1 hypothetical protein DEJ28_02340 [Curtobacterium sp. MCPF17_002]